MILEIPVRSGSEFASYTQRSELDGRIYNFRFDWNEREGNWYLDLSDQDEVQILSGIKLVSSIPLIARIVDERRPPGELFIIDNQSPTTDPNLDSLGARHRFIYLDAEELGRSG